MQVFNSFQEVYAANAVKCSQSTMSIFNSSFDGKSPLEWVQDFLDSPEPASEEDKAKCKWVLAKQSEFWEGMDKNNLTPVQQRAYEQYSSIVRQIQAVQARNNPDKTPLERGLDKALWD